MDRIKERSTWKYLIDMIPDISSFVKNQSDELDSLPEIYVPFLTLVSTALRYNVSSYYDIQLDGKTVGELKIEYGVYTNRAVVNFGRKSYYTRPHYKRGFDIEQFETEIYLLLRKYLPDFQIDPNQYYRIS